MLYGKIIVLNNKSKVFFKSIFSLMMLSSLFWSANANNLASNNYESSALAKGCRSLNIESVRLNIDVFKFKQTESQVIQKPSCGSTPSKSINQI